MQKDRRDKGDRNQPNPPSRRWKTKKKEHINNPLAQNPGTKLLAAEIFADEKTAKKYLWRLMQRTRQELDKELEEQNRSSNYGTDSNTDSEYSETMRPITPQRYQERRRQQARQDNITAPFVDPQEMKDQEKIMMDNFRTKYRPHLQFRRNGVILMKQNENFDEHDLDYMEPRSPENKRKRAKNFKINR